MVKLTVKTIKGKKFQIQVEPTQTVLGVKGVIEATNPEFPAAQLKLIHSGKILKDESTLEEYKIKEDEFLVCMVTKLKPAAPAASPAASMATPAPPAAPAVPAVPAPATAAPAVASPAAAAAPSAATATESSLHEDHIRQLTDMGFVEDQARAALRAALGNPDLAVEFLTTGIPDNFQHLQAAPQPNASMVQPIAASTPSSPGSATSGTMETLDDFRGHPQFNDLKRLVQRDPAMLSNVLQMIGQQSPNLLARIHENQQQFIELMNEPVDESIPPAATVMPTSGIGDLGSMMGSGAGAGDPAQMAQMLQSMNPAQRAQLAAAMGLSPQQLAQVSEVIGNMPPEQFQQLVGPASGAGIPGGIGGMRGMGGGTAGRNVIHLTEEEGASVTRLAELGFDRTDAVQAYLACDKNEALAANLLMDGMGAGMQSTFYPPAPASASAVAPTATSAATGSSVSAAQSPTTGSTSSPSAEPSTSSNAPPSSEQSPSTDSNTRAPDGQAEGSSGGDEDEDMYG